MFLPREPAWYLEGPVFDLSFHCHLGWIPGIQKVAQYPNIQTSLIRSPKKNCTTCGTFFCFFRSVVSLQYWNLRKIGVPNGRSTKLGLRDERSSFAQRLAEAVVDGVNGISTGSQRTFLFLQLRSRRWIGSHLPVLTDVSRTKNLSVCRRSWDVLW